MASPSMRSPRWRANRPAHSVSFGVNTSASASSSRGTATFAGAGLRIAIRPASRAKRSAAATVSKGDSSCARVTGAAAMAGVWASMKSLVSAALAPGPMTMLLRPWASTKMPAVPVGASLRWSRRSMASAVASARASCPPTSSPSAHRNTVAAPLRAAAVAWLKPLPPGPLA